MNFASVPEFSIILCIRLLRAISDIIGSSSDESVLQSQMSSIILCRYYSFQINWFFTGVFISPLSTTNHVGLEYIGVGGEISTPLKAIDLEAVVSNLLSVKRTKQFLKSFIQVQV